MKFILVFILACFASFAVFAAEPVNVNTASAEEISKNLKGIGIAKAQSIIEYREAHGTFLHVDELVNVKGIGVKTIDNNRGMILLENPPQSPEN